MILSRVPLRSNYGFLFTSTMFSKNWDAYGRQGVDLASAAASFGFTAAKVGTRLGVCLINFHLVPI